MRRLIFALLASLAFVACDMNPQPEVPGMGDPGAAGAAGGVGVDDPTPGKVAERPPNDDDLTRSDEFGAPGFAAGNGDMDSRGDGGREAPDAGGGAPGTPPVLTR
ncbi:MAG: hypothetical protein U0263_08265 [Polyangiaceae bacterium]